MPTSEGNDNSILQSRRSAIEIHHLTAESLREFAVGCEYIISISDR